MNHSYFRVIWKTMPIPIAIGTGSDNPFIRVIIVVFLFLSLSAQGQSFIIDSNQYSPAVSAAVSAYHLSMDKESKLYSGPEHIGYHPKMIGSAYFGSDTWQNGSVYYDDILYRDVPMKYDEVLDKAVVQHFNGVFKLELNTDQVKWFTLGGHTFIKLNADAGNNIKAGFYDLLVSGKITVLAKRIKLVTEFIEGNELNRRIDSRPVYYAVKDGVYKPISTKRSLFNILADQRKEVQQYLRKNKIKFKRKSEYAIVKAVEYYNQLSHD